MNSRKGRKMLGLFKSVSSSISFVDYYFKHLSGVCVGVH